MSDKTLILVHPGSMCGSARMHLGKFEADAAREAVLYEVEHHNGPLIVIDGFLSDELSVQERAIIEDRLIKSENEGHLCLRVWGCDAGEDPFTGWRSFGLQGRHAVFEDQRAAIRSVSHMIDTADVEVTGAWATDDLSSGCATSVLQELQQAIGNKTVVQMSPYALREPDEDLNDIEPA